MLPTLTVPLKTDSIVTLVTLGSFTGACHVMPRVYGVSIFAMSSTTSDIFLNFIKGEIVISVHLLITNLRKAN